MELWVWEEELEGRESGVKGEIGRARCLRSLIDLSYSCRVKLWISDKSTSSEYSVN